MMKLSIALSLVVVALATPSAHGNGQSQQALRPASTRLSNTPDDDPKLQHRNPRYQLCRSDVLELTFPLTPEFNQTVTVEPDGYITLHGADSIYVEGQTLAQVSRSIRDAYAGVLHEPIVAVDLKDFEKPYFIAGGQVGHPGKYELRGDTTVVQAVEIAGGFTDQAKHSEVWVFRRVSNDWVESHRIDVKNMLHSGKLTEDMDLQPGDMLYVPKNTLGKIQRYLPVATMGSYFNPAP
jgi:polysaccharide export outer membrane protein